MTALRSWLLIFISSASWMLVPASALAQPPLVVAIKEAPPFVFKNAEGEFEGPAVALWRHAAGELGLTYEFRELPLDELLLAVESGKADVGVGALTVTVDRERRLDFTHSYHSTGLAIAAREVEGVGVLSIARRFMSLRFLGAIGALLLVLLVTGAVIWLLERRQNPEQFGGNAAKGIASGVWWSAVTMTTVGYGDKAPVTMAGRLVALVWMFAAVITISGFTAGIASSLTSEQLTSVVGPSDLDSARVGTVTASASADFLATRGVRFREFGGLKAALEALRTGDLDAVVYDLPLLAWQLENEHGGILRVLPHTLTQQQYAFALPTDSPLRKDLNLHILSYTATPQWRRDVEDY